jgi:Nuclear pore complex assembly
MVGGTFSANKLLHCLLTSYDEVSLYPPKNSNDLHKLYNAIQKCDLDILRKHSLVYYLLLDWKNASQARYARRYLIPSQFQKLMDGYWAMDHGQYEVRTTKQNKAQLTVGEISQLLTPSPKGWRQIIGRPRSGSGLVRQSSTDLV